MRDQIEIVIVAPSGQLLGLNDSELEGFAGARLVEIDSARSFGEARAAGVRAAAAPLVFIGETHTYAHPSWAEALIQAHARPWAAVAPGFGNANSASSLSWANFLLDYGSWVDSLPAGEIERAPTYNTAYKRRVLLDLGDRLEHALSGGDELAVALRAAGQRSYFEPAARLDHLNVSHPVSWLSERFLGGLLTAASRRARWSRLRSLLYACGSPLIPVVLLARLRRPVRLLLQERRLPAGTLAALVAGAIVAAVGELVGYARGAGEGARLRMSEYELHKVRYAGPPTL